MPSFVSSFPDDTAGHPVCCAVWCSNTGHTARHSAASTTSSHHKPDYPADCATQSTHRATWSDVGATSGHDVGPSQLGAHKFLQSGHDGVKRWCTGHRGIDASSAGETNYSSLCNRFAFGYLAPSVLLFRGCYGPTRAVNVLRVKKQRASSFSVLVSAQRESYF